MMLKMLLTAIKKEVEDLYGVDSHSVSVDVCGDSIVVNFKFKGYNIDCTCMQNRVISGLKKVKSGNDLNNLAILVAGECQNSINRWAVLALERKVEVKEVKKDKKA